MPTTSRFTLTLDDGETVSALLTADAEPGPAPGDDLIGLAHGAGQGMDSPFMQAIADGLVAPGRALLRFNFPYMETAQREGRRKPPNRADKLEHCWRQIADLARQRYAPGRLFLGGKSMGGRIASHLAAAAYPCDGLVLLGYPLHPPGKPERLRKDHLTAVRCPMLFVQGTRDSLCRRELLEPVLTPLPGATLQWVEGGDHSFKVLKRLGRSEQQVMTGVCQGIADWMAALPAAAVEDPV